LWYLHRKVSVVTHEYTPSFMRTLSFEVMRKLVADLPYKTLVVLAYFVLLAENSGETFEKIVPSMMVFSISRVPHDDSAQAQVFMSPLQWVIKM